MATENIIVLIVLLHLHEFALRARAAKCCWEERWETRSRTSTHAREWPSSIWMSQNGLMSPTLGATEWGYQDKCCHQPMLSTAWPGRRWPACFNFLSSRVQKLRGLFGWGLGPDHWTKIFTGIFLEDVTLLWHKWSQTFIQNKSSGNNFKLKATFPTSFKQ